MAVKGTLRECRRSIALRGERKSSGARRRLARAPPSSGVCVQLIEGAHLGHDIGGCDAVDQHSLHRVVDNLAVIDRLGDQAIARTCTIPRQEMALATPWFSH